MREMQRMQTLGEGIGKPQGSRLDEWERWMRIIFLLYYSRSRMERRLLKIYLLTLLLYSPLTVFVS